MRLDVLYGCDDNYAPYTGVSMLSLLENNRNIESINIFLASMNVTTENLKKMKDLVKRYGRKLIVLDTESANQKMRIYNCKGWNGSLATWLRFFVLDQIPDEVERLLWLDSDTIVMSNLNDLVKLEMGEDTPIAAVCDSVCYWERFRLGLTTDEPYFNAGVLLFNLRYWRKHQTLSEMFEYLQRHIQLYKANDQDLLNDFFHGHILKLPQIYNLQGFQMAYSVNDYFSVYHWTPTAYYTPEQVLIALKEPCIVHFFRFLGDYPWQQGNNYHPAKQLYLDWKSRSPWKQDEGAPARTDIEFKVEKIMYFLFPKRIFLRVFAWITRKNT